MTISGVKVMANQGGPTEIVAPVAASRISGYRVPSRTVTAAAVRNRLLRTNAPSRLIGANRPPPFSCGARQANRAKASPAVRPRMASSIIPRSGSTANA